MPVQISRTVAAPDAGLTSCGVEDPGVALRRVLAPLVSMAVWRRRLPPGLNGWLDGLPPTRLPDGRGTAATDDVPRLVAGICDESQTPATAQRDAFIADVSSVARVFARVAELRAVRVRIEVIATNACRRYHRDCVGLRLLATYRGPGTLWVPRDHGAAALRLQERYRGPLRQLTRHEVAVYKGSHWPGESGLVHRSPPIEGTNAVRLLLAVDAPFDDCLS